MLTERVTQIAASRPVEALQSKTCGFRIQVPAGVVEDRGERNILNEGTGRSVRDGNGEILGDVGVGAEFTFSAAGRRQVVKVEHFGLGTSITRTSWLRVKVIGDPIPHPLHCGESFTAPVGVRIVCCGG